MGSGCLAAMAVFESQWRKDMEREEAIYVVQAAVEAGIFNDLGSGSNVDITIIDQTGAERLRNYAKPNERSQKEKSYKFERGTTGEFLFQWKDGWRRWDCSFLLSEQCDKFWDKISFFIRNSHLSLRSLPASCSRPQDINSQLCQGCRG